MELTWFPGHLIWASRGKEAWMGRPSRYLEEFRREAVELYRSSDRPRAEVARSLGISDGSLAAWVKQARQEAESGLDAHERRVGAAAEREP